MNLFRKPLLDFIKWLFNPKNNEVQITWKLILCLLYWLESSWKHKALPACWREVTSDFQSHPPAAAASPLGDRRSNRDVWLLKMTQHVSALTSIDAKKNKMKPFWPISSLFPLCIADSKSAQAPLLGPALSGVWWEEFGVRRDGSGTFCQVSVSLIIRSNWFYSGNLK